MSVQRFTNERLAELDGLCGWSAHGKRRGSGRGGYGSFDASRFPFTRFLPMVITLVFMGFGRSPSLSSAIDGASLFVALDATFVRAEVSSRVIVVPAVVPGPRHAY